MVVFLTMVMFRRHPLHPAACNTPLLRLPRLFRHLCILLFHLAEGWCHHNHNHAGHRFQGFKVNRSRSAGETLRPLHTRPGVAAQDALGPRPTHGVHAFDSGSHLDEDSEVKDLVLFSSKSPHNHLQRYALFHGLGLALDLLLLLVVGLCTLHFLDFDLPTAFFARF